MAQFSLGISAGARPLRVGSCEVYVGTCSWADPNFVKEGQFYPRGAGTDPKKRLQFYSTAFPTVEVDATYHVLQPAERAAHWVEWTPPQFIFTMKAFALFTGHDTDPRRLPKEIAPLIPESLRAVEAVGAGQLPEEVVTACWDYFTSFVDQFVRAGKLGHVLFQFPKGQGYTLELFEHLERWEPYLRRWPVAVGIRHRSWLQEPARAQFLAYLKQKGVAYGVPDLVHRAYLPPPASLPILRLQDFRRHAHVGLRFAPFRILPVSLDVCTDLKGILLLGEVRCDSLLNHPAPGNTPLAADLLDGLSLVVRQRNNYFSHTKFIPLEYRVVNRSHTSRRSRASGYPNSSRIVAAARSSSVA